MCSTAPFKVTSPAEPAEETEEATKINTAQTTAASSHQRWGLPREGAHHGATSVPASPTAAG